MDAEGSSSPSKKRSPTAKVQTSAKTRDVNLSSKSVRDIKVHGVHYSPDELSDFMAKLALVRVLKRTNPLSVFDPACGDGSLLRAIGRLADQRKLRTMLIGRDIDPEALVMAKTSLVQYTYASSDIGYGDYVQGGIEKSPAAGPKIYDVIISNPPYLRTQTMGALGSQVLTHAFGLDGRVDLYHAFIMKAMEELAVGGVMVFVTSNRFMVTNAGEQLRKALLARLRIEEIIDFGDTKIFEAAVLPVVFVGVKDGATVPKSVVFRRIYEAGKQVPGRCVDSLYEAVRSDIDQEPVRFAIEGIASLGVP